MVAASQMPSGTTARRAARIAASERLVRALVDIAARGLRTREQFGVWSGRDFTRSSKPGPKPTKAAAA
jgi:hypothetical protein